MPNDSSGLCRNGHDRAVFGTSKNGSCRECLRLTSERYRQRHPERAKANYKRWYDRSYPERRERHNARRRRANLPPEAVAELRYRDRLRWPKHGYDVRQETVRKLYEAQNGACAICGRKRRLQIDHCHRSGHVRALLCRQCNIGLGQFEDDPNLLRAALGYVQKHAL